MFELQKGEDILSKVGTVAAVDDALSVFNEYMDTANLAKIKRIENREALVKIANAAAMCRPDSIFIDSGTEDDRQWIKEYALARGEESPLAKPGHTIHFDLPEDQARLVNQTYYIVNEGEEVSALAQSIPRNEAHDYVQGYMRGIMKGMTMIVGFYSRGPVGAAASIPAIEISSSGYVLHSAEILYRNCFADFDAEVERRGFFFTNVHSQGTNRPEDVPKARIFMDRSWQTTYSTFCTYAGNTLLLKKGNHRLAVDYATYFRKEQELSEHMFITGMTGPGGRKTYFAGAAPSGCGKTTTAMVGSDFIGDDLAQLWIDETGTLRAVNPENGIFGIVEDVNRDGDPALMDCLRGDGTEVIWSNVLVDEEGVPQWVGNGEPVPERGENYLGEWYPGKKDAAGNPVPMSHKNSRCTLRCSAIANHNAEAAQDPAGVPVKVITYSGRDSDTMPPVWAAKSPEEGVAIGASIVSKATATEVGVTGVRRQPWANAPFIPGALSEYMEAQFRFFGSDRFSGSGAPVMAGLNYFLTHEKRGGKGDGLLGEKRDVKVWLGWLELFAHGDVSALETPIGYIPFFKDLQRLFKGIGKAYTEELYRMQFSLYADNIIKRLELQKEAYSCEKHLPSAIFEVYDRQIAALKRERERGGAVIRPEYFAQVDKAKAAVTV